MKACKSYFFLFPFLIVLSAYSQPDVEIAAFNKSIKTQDHLLPIQPDSIISFTTDEGSYMNVDISPDGKNILFDLLGDIYLLPSNGGIAKQLTRGISVKVRPVWSPDGKYFVYLSDACGKLCLNVRDLAGEFHKIIETPEYWAVIVPNLSWTPEGNALIFKDSLYHIFGETSILPENLFNLIGCSKDAKFKYYIDIIENEGRKMIDNGRILIKHNNFTGINDTILKDRRQDLGNAKITPDGKWLLYIKRSSWNEFGETDSLVARQLPDGPEKFLTTLRYRIIPTRFYARNLHYSFTSDSKSVYIGFGGKFHKIDLENASVTTIPFKAQVNVDVARRNNYQFNPLKDTVAVKYIRSAHRSPSGKQLVFAALNRIFIIDLPGGKPRALAAQNTGQFQPCYSEDGKWIVYVTWDVKEGGHVWKVRVTGGQPQQVTKTAGYYQNPSWAHDGNSIVVVKGTQETAPSNQGEILVISLKDLDAKIIDTVPMLNRPIFQGDDKSLIYKPLMEQFVGPVTDSNRLIPQLIIKNLSNGQTRVLAKGAFDIYQSPEDSQLPQILPSPDQQLIVYINNDNLYLSSIGDENTSRTIYDPERMVRSVRIAGGAMDPHWEQSGKILSWCFGGRYYRVPTHELNKLIKSLKKLDLKSRYTFIDQVQPESISINLNFPQYHAKGTTALQHVRIITMKGDIIQDGTLIISKGRIAEMGKSSDIKVPPTAKLFNLEGKTIIPGFIDVHSHMRIRGGDVLQGQPWHLLANLSYGVTTVRAPGSGYSFFGYAELIEAGQLKGPRCFSAGKVADEHSFIGNLSEAETHVKNQANMGAISIKQYDQQSRLRRQWTLLASNKSHLNMTNEGSFILPGFLGMIKDGSPGIEHFNPLGYDVYKDVKLLVAASQTYVAPTMQISNQGGEQGREYFRDLYKKLNDSNHLKKFTPRSELDAILSAKRENKNHPPDVYVWSELAGEITKLGGKIIMGGHGEDQGIGSHFELWALQMGGLTNIEALQASTILCAEALGIQKDLGSIEVGKIADLIVVDKNPLENIHNTLSIKYVMKDGILYDGGTLDIIWPATNGIKHIPSQRGFK